MVVGLAATPRDAAPLAVRGRGVNLRYRRPPMRRSAVLAFVALVSCRMEEESAGPARRETPATQPTPKPAAPAPHAGTAARPTGRKPAFRRAPAGDVAELARAETSAAKDAGRALVVYVGATWCEPCQRFHRAVEDGLLDADFPDVTFLEFDLDDDGPRLAAAGYAPKMIPLFALPGPDGRYAGTSFEGSIKGPGAIGDLRPKLLRLLGR